MMRTLFASRDWLRFALMVLIMVGGSLLELLSLAAIPMFVSLIAYSEPSTLVSSRLREWLERLIEALKLPQPEQTVLWGAVILFVIFLVRTFYLIGSFALQERLLQNRYIELSSRLFQAYLRAPLVYHLQKNSAELINNVHNETDRIVRYVLNTTLDLIRGGLTLLAILSLLLVYNPLVSSLSCLALGLAAGIFMFTTRRHLATLGMAMNQQRTLIIKNALEGIGAIKDAQILNCHDFFSGRLHLALQHLAGATAKYNLITRSTWPLMEFIACAVIIGAMAFMLLTQQQTSDVAPTIALVAACLARLKGIITEMMVFHSWRQSHLPIAKRLAADLQLLEKPLPDLNDSQLNHNAPCAISLDNITFSYPEQQTPAIRQATLHIPAGSTVGLVGPTGSGKSTLAAIIAALLQPQAGTLTIDRTRIATPGDIRAWQDHIGYVPQAPVLLDDTIQANIAFGIPTEDIDAKKLHEAICASQLDSFIQQQPLELDTIIGEQGVRLSGGQKQRIAIARALYRQPSCLIFDEATSALDVTTERNITQAINNLRGKHTIIVIAHRLSTIRHCDRIVFLKNGNILACDTYDRLRQLLPEFQAMTTP